MTPQEYATQRCAQLGRDLENVGIANAREILAPISALESRHNRLCDLIDQLEAELEKDFGPDWRDRVPPRCRELMAKRPRRTD